MKTINIASLTNSERVLDDIDLNNYLETFQIKIKRNEIIDIRQLFIKLIEIKKIDYNNFYVGYKIKQINKEFDLLRFGEEYHINIEIKNQSSSDTIREQLVKNQFYLKVLDKPVFSYGYVVTTNTLYYLDHNKSIHKVDLQILANQLDAQKVLVDFEIDNWFKPSKFLVSPFNSTEKFVNGAYFLTQHQQEIKKNIEKKLMSDKAEYIVIQGKPGTGKTLLNYDIVKDLRLQGINVAIIHCGYLNPGHEKLNTIYGWNIAAVKYYHSVLTSDVELVLIDETQRISIDQLRSIVQFVQINNKKAIFSIDPQQVFNSSEEITDILGVIKSYLNPTLYSITDKIRTNAEISSFITNILDLNKVNKKMVYKNIDIQFFIERSVAKDYINHLVSHGWEALNYSTSFHNHVVIDLHQLPTNLNSHQVIGQEFDNVVVVLDEHFYYNSEGKLSARKPSGMANYRLDKMFYQNITRARNKICIVIINNIELLMHCTKIILPHQDTASPIS